jgi:hypothetical protein
MTELPEHLLVVDVTIDAAVEADWNEWYDRDHLPALRACPGFIGARRYVSDTGGGRRYLTVYALEDPGAVDTPEFAAARGWYQFAGDVQATVRRFFAIPEPSVLSPTVTHLPSKRRNETC